MNVTKYHLKVELITNFSYKTLYIYIAGVSGIRELILQNSVGGLGYIKNNVKIFQEVEYFTEPIIHFVGNPCNIKITYRNNKTLRQHTKASSV